MYANAGDLTRKNSMPFFRNEKIFSLYDCQISTQPVKSYPVRLNLVSKYIQNKTLLRPSCIVKQAIQ
jgi:hypothetical protein